VSSRKVHAWRFRRSEEGKARETLRCFVDVEAETDPDAGGEVVSEFEVEGNGEGVDVDVVMARVWIVADVDRFEAEEGMANALWKKAEEEDDILGRVELDCRCRGEETMVVYNSVVWRIPRKLGGSEA